MLEQYFLKPDTVDRIRTCWLGKPIEQYVDWLAEQGYATRNIGSDQTRLTVQAKTREKSGGLLVSSPKPNPARSGDIEVFRGRYKRPSSHKA